VTQEEEEGTVGGERNHGGATWGVEGVIEIRGRGRLLITVTGGGGKGKSRVHDERGKTDNNAPKHRKKNDDLRVRKRHWEDGGRHRHVTTDGGCSQR